MASPAETDLLARAVERGIITAAQRDAIIAIAGEGGTARELPRGFNWVTVAYVLGAFLVVFAGGWFLAQRWLALGAPGVLAIITGYAAAAWFSSRWLERHDFPQAAGVAVMVAVSLTPVAVWALESMSGWWPAETWGRPYYVEYPPAEATRWLVAELATILAALLVLRRRVYSALGFPVAVAVFGLVMHGPRSFDIAITPVMERWTMLTGAVIACALADTVDRRVPRGRTPGDGDFAFPLWTVGLIALGAAILAFWPTAGVLRHGVPVLALAAIAAALVMGRRTHVVFGVLALFMYLMYLAGEVFKSTAYFPVALAAIGALLLALTVWLQRRFPALAARLGGRRGAGGLPGSAALPWLVAAMTLGITLLKAPEAAEERLDREFQQRLQILRQHSGSLRVAPSRTAPGTPSPRPAAPPPG